MCYLYYIYLRVVLGESSLLNCEVESFTGYGTSCICTATFGTNQAKDRNVNINVYSEVVEERTAFQSYFIQNPVFVSSQKSAAFLVSLFSILGSILVFVLYIFMYENKSFGMINNTNI